MANKFKRGTTFSVSRQISTGGDFTGWTGQSQMRTKELGSDGEQTLIQTLDFNWDDVTQGKYTVSSVAANTDTWPLGAAVFDVFLTSPSNVVVGTVTENVTIIRNQTIL